MTTMESISLSMSSNPLQPPSLENMHAVREGSLKRLMSEVIGREQKQVGHPITQSQKKQKTNAVSDILVRQQLLSGLIRSQSVGVTHSDHALSEHVKLCATQPCAFEECPLAKKCLAHFSKCSKKDCIVCVEARLNQIVDRSSQCSEDDRFQFSAWRARIQSVNDETKEYVPYFNACAKELLLARATKSPFIQAAKERFAAAKALVSQSEQRYAKLCAEIFSKWSSVTVIDSDDSVSSDTGSCCDTVSEHSESSPGTIPSDKSWHSTSDTPLRVQVLQDIFEWSKKTNTNAALLGPSVLLEGARKAECLLYSISHSRSEYEAEARRMCEGR